MIKGSKLYLCSERRVLLRRGPTGFGFHIIGGDGGEGTFCVVNFLFLYYKYFVFQRYIYIVNSIGWCS